MISDHINDLGCTIFIEAIGAESYHMVISNNTIYFFLITYEIIPTLFFKPKSISCQP
jgi:hypothetical protein